MGGSVSLPRRRADRLDLGRAGCNFLTSTVGLTWPSPVIRTPHPNPPPQGWRASESSPWPRDCRGLLATRTETSAPTREQLRTNFSSAHRAPPAAIFARPFTQRLRQSSAALRD